MVAFERRVWSGAGHVSASTAWNPAADLAGFRHLRTISLLGNQWVSSLGLPVLDLRRMLLLLLL
jgi:hypothetical protein